MHTHTGLSCWSAWSCLDLPVPGLTCAKEGFQGKMEEVLKVADSAVAQKSRWRQKTVWEAWQKEALLTAFAKNPYPTFRARQDMANQFGLPESRVRVWFQNRRSRTRQVLQGPRGPEGPSKQGSSEQRQEPGARAPGRSTTTEGRTRLRTRLSPAQLTILMQAFERDPKPRYAAREQLARRAGLPEDTIQIWFQNRRARCRPCLSRLLLCHGGDRGRVASQDSLASPQLNEEAQGLPGREVERAQDSSLPLTTSAALDLHPVTLTCPMTSSEVPLPGPAQHSGPNQDDTEPHSDAQNMGSVSDLFLDQILEELQVDMQAQDTVAPHDQWEQIEPALQAPLDQEEYQALLDLL